MNRKTWNRRVVLVGVAAIGIVGYLYAESREDDATQRATTPDQTTSGERTVSEKIRKTDDEWRSQLTPEQYNVTRRQGTERAYTGAYHDFKGKGTYTCVSCGAPLFDSDAKYDSGTGWPSFWEPIDDEIVGERKDSKFFQVRTEVICSQCDSHLGHVFEDGPPPTGLRYCINSAALAFEEKSED